jgi:energy-coupling factor transport system permease protein
MRTRPLAYRRRASPLHAARASAGTAYGMAFVVAALLIDHPLALGALLVVLVAAGAAAGVAADLRRAARVAAPLALLTVPLNVLVSRDGLTVFARLGEWGPLGQVDLTEEALVYGLVLALRLLVVVLAAALVASAVNPDEMLRMFRRVSFRSALTATLATRLLPVLGEDARRLADAQRCRPDGGLRGTRGRLAVLRAVVGGALDRALDVAATLEVRGYGAGRRPPRYARSWSRHDLAFTFAAGALVALAAVAHAAGVAPFDAYPLVRAPVGAGAVALALALVAVALAPFADRRGIEP